MQINNLAPTNITEAKPAAGVAAPEPVKPAAKPAPAAKPTATAVKPDAKAPEAKAPEGKKPEAGKAEITDVKPTGDTNDEGDPTFTLKVNGQEYKATQSEIIALAQKAKGAEAALKQKAELEKLTSDFLTSFDSDAFGVLVQRHGKDKAKEIAIAMVRNLIAEEAKDPKDVELERLRAENETHKAAQERAKKEQEDAQRKVQQNELYKTMLTEIDTELNDTHLPKDKLTLTRVLNFLEAGKKSNGTSWTIRDAVKAVEQEDMSHASHYAKRYVDGLLPSDQFRKIFGEETFKKLNKEQINLLKNADKIAKNGPVPPEPQAANGDTPQRKTRSLSKGKGSDGLSEREYRRLHGSLGGI